LSVILDRLAEQPCIDDFSPLLPYINDSRWLMHDSAILALKICKDPKTEDILLKKLSETENKYTRSHIRSVLGQVGTKKSIPTLIEFLNKTTGRERAEFILVINKLGDESCFPLFLKELNDRNGFVKWAAMGGILKHGNSDAIIPVTRRVKAILSKPRKMKQSPKSELMEGLEFLYQYRNTDKSIQELFDWVQNKKLDLLFDREKKEFNDNKIVDSIII
jgi:HEAT repeat protein